MQMHAAVLVRTWKRYYASVTQTGLLHLLLHCKDLQKVLDSHLHHYLVVGLRVVYYLILQ